MKKFVYLDHASTTPLDSEVFEKMTHYLTNVYGNANSQHFLGREAVKAVDEARDNIASIINCKANEVYFTSGGTESDNWAIKGVAFANKDKGKHIIVSEIEHPAVLESVKFLSNNGFKVDFIKVDKNGIVDLEHLKSIIDNDTIIVGCMMANNEIGTIQPIKEISKIAKSVGAYMFCDAVQTAGVLKIDVNELGVDLLSISSHKIYGPKGVGALYVKNGVRIDNLMSGGHQERTKRGGTTNTAGIVGFSEAFKKANNDLEKNYNFVLSLRNRFIEGIKNYKINAILNGDNERRLPANADFCFKGLSGEAILYNLDLEGVFASSGSACSSGSLEPSHVLKAIGLNEEDAKSSIRFTFGKDNTVEDVDYALSNVKKIVDRLNKK